MKRYIIERDIPEIGSADRDALREAAKKSNSVLAELAPNGDADDDEEDEFEDDDE